MPESPDLTDPNKFKILPAVALRDMVVFPNALTPLLVVRSASLAALDAALNDDKRVFLITQKSSKLDSPSPGDLRRIGCEAEVLQVLHMSDGAAKALVEGKSVSKVIDFYNDKPFLKAYVSRMEFPTIEPKFVEALRRTVLRQFETYASLCQQIPEDIMMSVRSMQDPISVANAVANYIMVEIDLKQQVLEAETVDAKLKALSEILMRENELLELETRIVSQVKGQISQSQREYFLNEQIKVIEKELGRPGEESRELLVLEERLNRSRMPLEARRKTAREIERLGRMGPLSPEATVARTYVDWLLDVPWDKRTKDKEDLDGAQKVLDEDHYGLEKIKDRMIDHLAALRLARKMKGPILCLAGPPGVGKTSLARSIARALGRKFIRVSLGGVRDEAEIRGHRRTYIGALPGKIIQGMKKAGACNPVFLLDEIDKMSSDFRGDPASAMLEALDPEQNNAFNDHYLEVDYDLSEVMFITTANDLEGIPHPLLDRMEVLTLSGYTTQEKERIAEQFLIPKQRKSHGLSKSTFRIDNAATLKVIEAYTREAGVRQLEREIAALCRKAARTIVSKKSKSLHVTAESLSKLLGPAKRREKQAIPEPEIGLATGLAWTEAGGVLLPVETTVMKGQGNLQLTGRLGDVLQESARAALTYLRARADRIGAPADFHRKMDLHVHIPEGATPKDGPSAGVALVVSLASALSRRPARQDIAMTGEITLRGHLLKIGGLKEKALAAQRAGIRKVIVPEENRGDLEDIPVELRSQLEFLFYENVEQALNAVLLPAPTKSAPEKSPAFHDTKRKPKSQPGAGVVGN